MGRNIILTETQFKEYLKSLMLNEGEHRTSKTRTYGQKIRDYVIPPERKLNQMGMTLFSGDADIETLNAIADAIDAKEMTINEFLDEDNFADEEAYQLVLQWIKGIRYSGTNKYADVLSAKAVDALNADADAREANKLNNMSDKERAIARNAKIKDQKYKEYFSIPQFNCDAFNFYTHWANSEFPVETEANEDIESFNGRLMPYFEQEPNYNAYMAVKKKCGQMPQLGGLYAFDGTGIYTPIVGKPTKLNSGWSFAKKDGKSLVPKGWREMYTFLREGGYNPGVLQVVQGANTPPCFYVPIQPK